MAVSNDVIMANFESRGHNMADDVFGGSGMPSLPASSSAGLSGIMPMNRAMIGAASPASAILPKALAKAVSPIAAAAPAAAPNAKAAISLAYIYLYIHRVLGVALDLALWVLSVFLLSFLFRACV